MQKFPFLELTGVPGLSEGLMGSNSLNTDDPIMVKVHISKNQFGLEHLHVFMMTDFQIRVTISAIVEKYVLAIRLHHTKHQ